MFNCAYLQSTRVIRVIFELVQVFVGFGVIRALGYLIRFLLYAEIIFNFYSKLILLNRAISYIFHDFIYHLLLFLQRCKGKINGTSSSSRCTQYRSYGVKVIWKVSKNWSNFVRTRIRNENYPKTIWFEILKTLIEKYLIPSLARVARTCCTSLAASKYRSMIHRSRERSTAGSLRPISRFISRHVLSVSIRVRPSPLSILVRTRNRVCAHRGPMNRRSGIDPWVSCDRRNCRRHPEFVQSILISILVFGSWGSTIQVILVFVKTYNKVWIDGSKSNLSILHSSIWIWIYIVV